MLRGSCLFGRHTSNDVQLQSVHASRQHAIIQWQNSHERTDEGGYWLIDLGSSNGSYVNGRRVSKPIRLKPGDMLDLGGIRMAFQVSDEAEISDNTMPDETPQELPKHACWLMVADIVGSTALSEGMESEEASQFFGTWFKNCRALIESQGGHMNHYFGDGFLSSWKDSGPVGRNIIHTLLQFAHRQATQLPAFRVVLHYGTVVLGHESSVTAQTLHGTSVNYVVRMEKLAAELGEQVLISADAAEKLFCPTSHQHHANLNGFEGDHVFYVPDLGALAIH